MRTFFNVLLIGVILSGALAAEYHELNVLDFFDVPESTFKNQDWLAESKIVNGKPIDINEMPWLMFLAKDGIQQCGAALVTPNHVVSAAHCIIGDKPVDWTVKGGSALRDQASIVRQVKNFTIHPNYKDDGGYDYDVAVLEFDEPILNTMTIKLAKKTPKDKSTVRIAGWGDLKEGKTTYGTNQASFVDVNVISRKKCQDDMTTANGIITKRMFCAYAEGRDSCLGDSGGPAVDENGHLCGIVSWGFGCARKDVPGMYTNIASVRYWIKEVIASYKL